MKKQFLTIVLLLACTLTGWSQNLKFGKPTNEELNMTVYEQDPDAPAVVLCYLTTVNYTMDFYNYIKEYQVKKRIKILKDEGKDYADVSFHYINNEREQYGQESVQDLKATAYNVENGKVVKTKIGPERLFKERIDEDYMLAKFAVPQVKAGTVIEYEYKIHSNVFFHIYDWDAQDEIPVAFAKYELTIPSTLIFNVEASDMKALTCTVTQGSISFKNTSNDLTSPNTCKTNIYTCVGRNLKALKKDDFVWNVRDYVTKVTAEMKSIFAGGIYQDVRKKWEQVDDVLLDHPSFGKRLDDHSKFRDELAASGIPEMTDLKEKVVATYKMLKSKLAWNGKYDLLPRSASEIIKKGDGTNADLNMILINMLGDVGVKAVPVVMSTRSHGRLPQTYPSLNKLNTFIVGVPDGSSWIYLDASASDGYLNVLPANLYTDQARVLQKKGQSRWENLQKISEARTLITVEASLSADGMMAGKESVIYSGNAAAAERKAFRTAGDSIAFMADKAKSLGVEIVDCEMEGHRDFSPWVKETINFKRQGDATDDHIYISPFVDIPITKNPFLDVERILPVEFPFKQTFNMAVQLTLPEGWKLEEGIENRRITTTDGSISGQILCDSREDNTLSLQYRFRLNDLVYTQDKYATLKQLFDFFANHSKDMLVVKRVM